MCLQGSLDELSIQDVLQLISLGRKTGWLSVDTPSGGGAIVFRHGRVLASIDDGPHADTAGLARVSGPVRDELIRERIAASLERVARSRRGEFSFQVSSAPPLAIGGRDISGESLHSGIDVIELLIDIACRQAAEHATVSGPDEGRAA